MATAQDLSELRYIIYLTHKDIYSGRKHSSYLVGQWPDPDLSKLAHDEDHVINIHDSVYYSPKITHAKVYKSIIDAQKDTNWLVQTRSEWKPNIKAVHAKIFFVAGLGNNKYE
jgi:hypothetical protein